MKAFRLVLVLFITCLFAGATYAKSTMMWEMLPNESLVELAAKFYPKSSEMQHAFILKTQQLNQETPVYTNAHSRYPTATKIVIPTLKSLSVRGSGAKKWKRLKKTGTKKAVSKPSKADAAGLKAQNELVEKEKDLDASLEKQNAALKLLEAKMSELQKQLDQAEKVPAKKAAVKTPSVSNKTSAP
jgi:hypothetical protein